MNTLKILGKATDLRTNTAVLYAQIYISEYFDLIGENYNQFQLQRRKEKHKGYKRLKADLKKGALLPTITLAIEPSVAQSFLDKVNNDKFDELLTQLKGAKENIYILDGLQRTHLIKELIEEGIVFKDGQKLLLEIWVEPEITHLVYRLIVLNSGQKPMSMRHQLELLFTTMRVTLTNEIQNLEILEEKNESRRSKPRQFPFDRIVTAYHSFLRKSPEIDKTSIVSEKMLEEKLMDESEEFITSSFQTFKEYLRKYCELDDELYRVYSSGELRKFRNWLADANVINAFFAAIGKLENTRPDRIDKAINLLMDKLKSGKKGEDIIKLSGYSEVKSEVADPKQYNVGFITRKLLTVSFTEYFRDEGMTSLYECWMQQSIELKK
ncbi:MAG: hypothetical protein LAT51_12640 [Flavobacteriaceae bacterium]|nr:hypothetical protein [Flavobacteriaceae bacterium]